MVTHQARRQPCALPPARSRRAPPPTLRSRGKGAAAPGDGELFLRTGPAMVGGLPGATAGAGYERRVAVPATLGATAAQQRANAPRRLRSSSPPDRDLCQETEHVFNTASTRGGTWFWFWSPSGKLSRWPVRYSDLLGSLGPPRNRGPSLKTGRTVKKWPSYSPKST